MDERFEQELEMCPRCSRARTGRPASSGEYGDSITVIYDAREQNGMLRLSQSDCSFDSSQICREAPSGGLLRRSHSEGQMHSFAMDAPQPCSVCFEEEADEMLAYGSDWDETVGMPSSLTPILSSLDNSLSVGTITSRLTATDSQYSDYTTESSYQTAESSVVDMSEYSELGDVDNHIREVHVTVDPTLNELQIHAIRNDLRQLLCGEMDMIDQMSGGNRSAIYVIAYQYM